MIAKNATGPCESCGQDFTARQRARKFCSRTCSVSYAVRARSYTRAPIQERFWKYVTAGPVDECWEWQGSRDHHGYGRLSSPGADTQVFKAHRVSYELHVGPIPDGLHMLHSCDNPPCVNPNHLRPGTPAENARDKVERGRARSGGRYLHSDETVAAVVLAVRAGDTVEAVAERFGVKERWVTGLLYGERRRDVIDTMRLRGDLAPVAEGLRNV